MPYPKFSNIIGLVLVHHNGNEYYINCADDEDRRLGLCAFGDTITYYMSYHEFFQTRMSNYFFYASDDDDTLYPLKNYQQILGLK